MEAEITQGDSGEVFGIDTKVTLSILPHQEGMKTQVVDPLSEPKMFHRCGIKWHTDGSPSDNVRWLVGELNGVRAYVIEDRDGRINIILSDRDLRP